MQEWIARIPAIELAAPWWLLLLPLLALLAWVRVRRDRLGKNPVILFPGLERLRDSGFEARRELRHLPQWLRWSALVLCVFALAGPRMVVRQTEAEARGIDVMLALDISESMLQKDGSNRSRLDAAREVARKFVLRRSSDRIGLVVFRGKGYTQCPLTIDHDVLAMLIDHISPLVIQDEGTAIGSAILIATNRFKGSTSLQKVIILITDGENNTGDVGPATAATLAAQNGIRIYVVNAGFKSTGSAGNLSAESSAHAAIDEASLRGIARTTGGGYFRAEDPSVLDNTIKTIGRLETARHAGAPVEHRTGLFFLLLFPAVLLLVLEVLLSNTRLMRIP
ncbi:VWA domain-containing protein [Chlorobium sp. BLA1]|uniref:VWA domain-containing protein n=1 Tax=Candidatus Chlorobium masyuteum TaxID=2716876 RepID=UPI001421A3BA|nr:VWA domain-containing protein [Candidatus Chlorobium masyuteum]NHQ59482.1 VWA domain-containing protein [Candidatus Chlorobium masyuteum]NTU45220.1 VWA domain-containing protein [Chlorobiaceae bacterium]